MKINVLAAIFLLTLPLGLYPLSVDLREPLYSDGVLTTEQGGVITAQDIRIQACKIRYTKRADEGEEVGFVEAEGDLIIEFGEYIFVGQKLEYDFVTKRGVVYCGRTAMEPWFFGGEKIELRPDGSYVIHNGYATTSENYRSDWRIETERARLQNNRYLTAHNVKFRFISLPLFWMPSFRVNLDSIFNSPFRYTVKWGGTQGPRVGMTYEVFSWRRWSSLLRLDWRLKGGLGGGFEVNYKSSDHLESFRSVNYIAEERRRYDRKERSRYRFQGNYDNLLDCGRTSIRLQYDKLSDKDMATDYYDRGLRLDTAKRTEFEVRRQENDWIFNFLTRLRLNSFQTIKQELPTFAARSRPWAIGGTGVISQSRFELSYLELVYSEGIKNSTIDIEQFKTYDSDDLHDYNSTRFEFSQKFYRPFKWNRINLTPEIEALAIYYGNNPNKQDRWMTIGLFGLDINTDFYRYYGNCKHVATPYLRYQYYTYPSTEPDDHYIFDINDGWYRLNTLRMGLLNNLYGKSSGGCIYRKLYLDLYTYAFFDTDKFRGDLPKGYLKLIYNVTPLLKTSVGGAWDFPRNMLDHSNMRLDWTVSDNLALAMEYRHRSPFDWRKVDHTNFIVDSFQNEDCLEHSSLSDRRDTFLFHCFYRFHNNWAIEAQTRSGWNRKIEPGFNEYQIDILGTFRSSCHLRLSYRHRENDDRFSFNFSIGLSPPNPEAYRCKVPCLEF